MGIIFLCLFQGVTTEIVVIKYLCTFSWPLTVSQSSSYSFSSVKVGLFSDVALLKQNNTKEKKDTLLQIEASESD